jgi:hypothetical protein
MTREEYFTQWSDDYYASAQSLKEKLNKLKAKVRNGGDPATAYRIQVLYQSYLDCLYIAKELKKHAEREKAKALRIKN